MLMKIMTFLLSSTLSAFPLLLSCTLPLDHQRKIANYITGVMGRIGCLLEQLMIMKNGIRKYGKKLKLGKKNVHATNAPRIKTAMDTYVIEFTDKESLDCTLEPVHCAKRILNLSHSRNAGITTEIIRKKRYKHGLHGLMAMVFIDNLDSSTFFLCIII